MTHERDRIIRDMVQLLKETEQSVPEVFQEVFYSDLFLWENAQVLAGFSTDILLAMLNFLRRTRDDEVPANPQA